MFELLYVPITGLWVVTSIISDAYFSSSKLALDHLQDLYNKGQLISVKFPNGLSWDSWHPCSMITVFNSVPPGIHPGTLQSIATQAQPQASASPAPALTGMAAWAPAPKFFGVDATGKIVGTAEASKAPACECGSSAVGSPSHSSWCPLHN